MTKRKSLQKFFITLTHNLENKLHLVFFLYALGGMAAYLLSSSLVFEPPLATYQDVLKHESDTLDLQKRFKIQTDDGALISAQYFKNPNSKYTILYSHGNAEDLGMIEPIMHTLYSKGFSVLAYDYRGYGTSEGIASEGNTYRDVDAAYHYLAGQGILASEIILFGRSLGAGPSTELASKHVFAGLILDSPYLSMFKIKTVIPLYPVDQYKNDSKISNIKAPLLILHGTKDRVVPFWHGEGLFELANTPKYALWFEGGGHSNLIKTAQDAYFGAITDFALSLENTPHFSKALISKISFTKAGNP